MTEPIVPAWILVTGSQELCLFRPMFPFSFPDDCETISHADVRRMIAAMDRRAAAMVLFQQSRKRRRRMKR